MPSYSARAPVVVRLDLEPGGRGALVQRPPGQRGHHRGGQAPPPVRRGRPRPRAKPAHRPSTTQPPDRGRAPAPVAGHGGEPHRRPAAQHLQRHLGPGRPCAGSARSHASSAVAGQRDGRGVRRRSRERRQRRRSAPARHLRVQPRASSSAHSAPGCPRRRSRPARTRAARARRTSARTAASASSSGSPGSPSGSTELARRVNPAGRPQRPLAERLALHRRPGRGRRSAPAPRTSAAGPPARGPARRARPCPPPATIPRCGRVSPSRRVISSTPSSQDVRTPTVSVNFGRPSPISVSRRTETRFPTSAGVMRTSSRPPAENSTGHVRPSCSDRAQERRY